MDQGLRVQCSPGMPDAPKSSQTLREQAERCRRLARSITDAETIRKLMELAAELEERAKATERGSRSP